MPDDKNWMKACLAEAASAGIDVPVAAIVVVDGKALAVGVNERERAQDPTAHAEILAIRRAAKAMSNWRLIDATLYCTLEPCPMCAEAIIQARIKRVVFGAYDPLNGAAGSKFNLFIEGRPFPLPEVTAGILEEECSTMLKTFFKERRAEKKG